MRQLLILLALALPLPTLAQIRPVEALDLARYAGTWHEVARLPMYFERKCVREVTATYRLREDGKVNVTNACTTAEGERISVQGVARRVGTRPATLEVRFAPAWLSFLPAVWADYWVIGLDPEYRWAMVGAPSGKYLWLLSREPVLDRATYLQLRARAEAMGYDLSGLLEVSVAP